MREEARAIECIADLAASTGSARAHALAEARHILTALADAEAAVLVPAFVRARLRPETQRLLEDSRGDRAEQLAALDELAARRGRRTQKIAALQLADLIKRSGEALTTLLVPVLSSQLPRPLYRSIVHAFVARYNGEDQLAAPPTAQPANNNVPVARAERA